MKKYFAHKTAIIDKGAKIGKGTKIWHNVHVTSTAIIGENCIIGQNCYVAGKVGNNCKLQNNVNVYEQVELRDFVFCGPSMTFTNVINPRSKYIKEKHQFLKTKVETGVTIGANSTIICGVKIGKWAFIGAASVVTKNVLPHSLVYGNPARHHGWINKKGEKVSSKPKS